MTGWRGVLAALGCALAVVLLPSSAWSVDCTATPDDPACVSPSADPSATAPPAPTATVTETVTAAPDPAPNAPGTDTGVYVDPASGNLRVDQNTGVAIGVAAWLLAVVGGLLTAYVVIP